MDPTGSPWTFAGGSGVAGNGSAVTSGNPAAPQGTQVTWMQNGSTISQAVNFAAGSYTISFDAAQRGNYSSNSTVQVKIDGQTVGSVTPTGTSYALYTTNSFTVTAGNHTVAFVSVSNNGGSTALLDAVSIATAPAAVQGPISSHALPVVGQGLIGQGGLANAVGSFLSGTSFGSGTLGGALSTFLSGSSSSPSGGGLLQELESSLLTAFTQLETALRNDLLFMESQINQFLQSNGLAQLLAQLQQQGASGPLGKLLEHRSIDQFMSGPAA
jgi:hypothetical protein